MSIKQFQQAVLSWFQQYGRHDLPWQQNASPYRVWVSEIMLQQTQVATVIPYFEKFIQRFPDVEALAQANSDEVLQYWAGLGYYARARNLHRSAQLIMQQYAGSFPNNSDQLQALPGIGRSTAGAILALAFGQRAAILDGNVKRVLARVHRVAGWPGKTETLQKLWQLAEQYTPSDAPAAYTQAMMDLGATICTRSRPKCNICPLATICAAHEIGQETAYPERKIAKVLPVRQAHFLIMRNSTGQLLLYRRPPMGIWGGLWSLPESSNATDIDLLCFEQYGVTSQQTEFGSSFRHTFSHFHLDITPAYLSVIHYQPRIHEGLDIQWYTLKQALALGIPKPVKDILTKLVNSEVNYGT